MELGMATHVRETSRETVIEIDEDLATRILKSAVNDYLAWPSRHVFHQCAAAWLFADFEEEERDRIRDDLDGFISMTSVCEMLGLDSERIKVAIKCKADNGKKRMLPIEFRRMMKTCEE